MKIFPNIPCFGLAAILVIIATAPFGNAFEAITQASTIRSLPRSEAGKRHPVKITGVVTFRTNRANGAFVVNDATAGIYVGLDENSEQPLSLPGVNEAEIKVGTMVEVVGTTDSGGYAPVIMPSGIRILGADKLPSPTPVTRADLRTGKWDCQRASIRGVVRYAQKVDSVERVKVDLATDLGRLTVFLPEERAEAPAELIDCKVDLVGVVFHFFNDRGQMLDSILQACGPDALTVIERGPKDPYAAPEVILPDVLQFSPEGRSLARTKIRGVVTLAKPGEFFYLQQGEHGIRVTTRITTPLEPGDSVEASGFLGIEEDFAELGETVFRKVGRGEIPKSLDLRRSPTDPISVNDFKRGSYPDLDGRLVSVNGELLSIDSQTNRMFLKTSHATVPIELQNTRLDEATWISGSRLRVTGVCKVDLSYGYPELKYPKPTDFKILLNSLSYVELLEKPSWWTTRRLSIALAIAAVIIGLALAWAGLLKKKIRERTLELASEIHSRIQAEVEFDATLSERQRLATDLHDGLEQSLTGVAFRVEAMVLQRKMDIDDPTLLGQLRQMLDSLREEVRRSVWNLRSNALDEGGLAEALEKIGSRLTVETGISISVRTEGERRVISDFIATQLLMLAQEATNNAIKNSGAKAIDILIRFAEEDLEMRIHDDGCGFDPSKIPGPSEGHFGIQGMRERSKRIGAEIRWDTRLGAGTTIIIKIKLPLQFPPRVNRRKTESPAFGG